MKRSYEVHREVEGTRTRTGPMLSTLGVRAHEAATECGLRLPVSVLTRSDQAVTCQDCHVPHLDSPTKEGTDG